MNDQWTSTGTSAAPQRPARFGRRARTVALVAGGVLAGATLAGAISASADTGSTGGSSSASSGYGQPGYAQPGNGQSGSGQSGSGQPGNGQGPRRHGGSAPVRGDEKSVSTEVADKLKAAAVAKVPGATAYRVETDAGDAAYEVHMTKSDGSLVTVKFDKDLNVTAVEDGMGKGDPAPAGGQGHQGQPGQQGQGGQRGSGQPSQNQQGSSGYGQQGQGPSA
jgi:hypothetical protein